MRKLAMLILIATVFSAAPVKAAGTNEAINQDAKQILETKNSDTFNDNFLMALYAPKVGNIQFSKDV